MPPFDCHRCEPLSTPPTAPPTYRLNHGKHTLRPSAPAVGDGLRSTVGVLVGCATVTVTVAVTVAVPVAVPIAPCTVGVTVGISGT